MSLIRHIIEFLFSAALFLNTLLFIPQAVKIFKKKTAEGVSLITFVGFLFIQLAIIAYGLMTKDYLLAGGYFLSMITCGLVVIAALLYRHPKNTSK